MNINRLGAGNRSILTLAVLLLLVGVVSLVGLVDASLTATRPAAAQPAASGDFPTAVRQIAADVRPGVVQITSEQVQVGQFNQPFSVPSGVGSGVLYDAQGHILTNDHVVAGARQLLVSLPDGRSFPGTLVGTDPQTDVAVLQITGDNLPQVTLGDSRDLQVGDWVVAIGNALALPGGPTVTQGVVSALGRSVQEPGTAQGAFQAQGPTLFDAIQTDAPINPGNSGGPLTNLQGHVIGINTLVAGQAEPGVQAQGIGFAIAIDTAKPIADQLVATGHAVHPFLGVSFVALNPAIAAQLGTRATSGVVVAQVAPGSPAATSLQPQDVITQVDGQALSSDTDLARAINNHHPGDMLTLSLQRGNQQLTVSITLTARP
jgi:S1-C subfamily serine protease